MLGRTSLCYGSVIRLSVFPGPGRTVRLVSYIYCCLYYLVKRCRLFIIYLVYTIDYLFQLCCVIEHCRVKINVFGFVFDTLLFCFKVAN